MDPFVPVPSFDSEKLAGSTLILPSVSIGNVPQLTCDLFIHTLHPERVGYIPNEAVMPVAGPREGATGVSLAVEVFQTKDQQWTIIQQRAPTFKGKRRQYVLDLVAFIQKYRFARVIVLTSADATFRTDTQITSAPFRFIGAPVNGIPELEDEELLHGTGIGRSLYKALAEAQVPTSMIVMFALEGDNVSDSFHLADVFNTAAQIRSTQEKGSWTPPKSWDYLFGLPVNRELYQ